MVFRTDSYPYKIPLRNHEKRIVAYALVDKEDFERVMAKSWHINNSGYAFHSFAVTPGRKGKKSGILMHRFILNAPSNAQVDHILGNRLDNRKQFLRLCSHQQNTFNRKGLHGIYNVIGPRSNSWRASIGFRDGSHKKDRHLGTFKTKEEAVVARKTAELILFKDFAPRSPETTARKDPMPEPRQVPNCLRNLNEALDHAKYRVTEEILSCPDWEKEDKEEWQRRRVVVARRLMAALSEYL